MSACARRLIGIVDVAQICAREQHVQAVVQRALRAGMRIFVLRAKKAENSALESIAWVDIITEIQEHAGIAILHSSLLSRRPDLGAYSVFQHGSAVEIQALAERNARRATPHAQPMAMHSVKDTLQHALSSNTTFGASAHNEHELRAAQRAGAAWAFVSPFAASASKPNYGPHLGSEGVQRLSKNASLPIFVLGGITPSTISALHDTKVAGCVVMGMLTHARANLEIKALFQQMESRAWTNPLPW